MHMQRKLFSLGLSAVLGMTPLSIFAQNPLGQTEIPLVAAARAAFLKDKVVHSVRIEGNAKAYAGRSIEVGMVVMTANISGANTFELRLDKGSTLTNQSAMKAGRTCTWSGQDGKVHQTPQFNCWTATTWFLPHLSLLTSDQDVPAVVGALDMGINTDTTGSYRKLRHQVALNSPKSDPKVTDLIRSWSTSNLRLDPVTFLPRELDFVIHPDNNSNVNINAEVRFSDYRSVDGVEMPYHVQRYLNGSLELDIEATQITVQ